MSLASMMTVLSYTAPSSLLRLVQYSTARSHSSPSGDMGRPFRYWKVTSSGPMRPARAPASIAMLEMDMRASMDSLRMASPANSMVHPVPPAVPIRPHTCRMMSLDRTPAASSPSIRISMFFPLVWARVCVANTCSTSLVPIPNASAPKAPWVAVWLSPHTHVVPGRVNPCSGPMMCTMPCRSSAIPKYFTPKSRTFCSICSTCVRELISSMKEPTSASSERSSVGTLWSTVARVQSGRRRPRLARRRPSKAWGEVTSWTR
mmetsp:Transcript_5266/g.10701  ORF Transcript_5266/g.10701 Transcript_5266/m.10701 type:complete len:261 (-) Transcript_5266:464-1246(-)